MSSRAATKRHEAGRFARFVDSEQFAMVALPKLTKERPEAVNASAGGASVVKLPCGGVPLIRALLTQGRRIEAGEEAERSFKDADDKGREEIVHLLTDEVRKIGDRHAGPGRPKRNQGDPRVLQVASAAYACRAAVRARKLIDGKNLTAADLVNLAWYCFLTPESLPGNLPPEKRTAYDARILRALPSLRNSTAADLSGARAALQAYATELLKGFGLRDRIQRGGFIATTQCKIAELFRVSVYALKRKLAQ